MSEQYRALLRQQIVAMRSYAATHQPPECRDGRACQDHEGTTWFAGALVGVRDWGDTTDREHLSVYPALLLLTNPSDPALPYFVLLPCAQFGCSTAWVKEIGIVELVDGEPVDVVLPDTEPKRGLNHLRPLRRRLTLGNPPIDPGFKRGVR